MNPSRPAWFLRASARIVRASTLVDRVYLRFDRLRTRTVLAFGGLPFYRAYNALTYSADDAYRAGAAGFRDNLFLWEEQIFRSQLPAPPARLLIGGCGGGREAFALAKAGYTVVGFDPIPSLVHALRAAHHPGVEAWLGRYESLPALESPDGGAAIDLSRQPAFDGAILGWGSFSHLLTDQDRIGALRRMAALTNGPIILSYLPAPERADTPRGPTFSARVGYYRELMGREVRAFAAAADLDVLLLNDHDNWPHAVLRARVSPPSRSPYQRGERTP
jgi:SAM-dependent methyltransferase